MYQQKILGAILVSPIGPGAPFSCFFCVECLSLLLFLSHQMREPYAFLYKWTNRLQFLIFFILFVNKISQGNSFNVPFHIHACETPNWDEDETKTFGDVMVR